MSEHGHHHHGHGMHAGNGGDGQSLAQSLGLGHNHGHGHSFLSHLLGLDHDAHGHGGGHAHGHGSGVNHAPSQSAGWNSALQAIKLSDALQGINVTPNFLFVVLFLGLGMWLYVIYWVRHHEPLANSVLGTRAVHSATAAADRRLVAGTCNALPLHTTAHMGEIYVPATGGQAQAQEQSTVPAPPLPPVPAPAPQPVPLAADPFPAPGAYVPAFGQPSERRDAFMVPEAAAAGTRVKMIVNR